MWFLDVPELLIEPKYNTQGGSVNMIRAIEWKVSHSGGAGEDENCKDDDIYINLVEDS